MFCNKCGNNIPENSMFCPKCGASQLRGGNEYTAGVQPSTQQQQSVLGLCLPMCILRFVDAAIWTVIVISQLSWGVEFTTVIWNILMTGISFMFAVRLLGVCRSNVFDGAKISSLVRQNRTYSGIGILWYGAQFLFFFVSNLVFISLLLEISILIIAMVILSRLSKIQR